MREGSHIPVLLYIKIEISNMAFCKLFTTCNDVMQYQFFKKHIRRSIYHLTTEKMAKTDQQRTL